MARVNHNNPTTLYVFKLNNNKVKIGISYCPINRAQRLVEDVQRLGYSESVEILYTKIYPDRYVAKAYEKLLHDNLKEYKEDYYRVGGYTEIFTHLIGVVSEVKKLLRGFSDQVKDLKYFDPYLTVQYHGKLEALKKVTDYLWKFSSSKNKNGLTYQSYRVKAKCILANLILCNREDTSWILNHTLTRVVKGDMFLLCLKSLNGKTCEEICEMVGINTSTWEDITIKYDSTFRLKHLKVTSVGFLGRLHSVVLAVKKYNKTSPKRDKSLVSLVSNIDLLNNNCVITK
tara:strand:- start:5421 stop:6281 length:861 start_codon:yes stop_codon:yes gene_type:complete